MRSSFPSATAMITAFLRASHLAVDEAPFVFEDTEAALYLPSSQQRFLQRLSAMARRWRRVYRQRRRVANGIRSQVLVRARYAEDALAAARDRGCERYVILGAGLDTYAQRHAADSKPMPVIEIDYPTSQDWKRTRLAEQGMAEPANVSYLPVDFEQQHLAEVLPACDGPQFISWLGTTYYLTREAIVATLEALFSCSAPGSEVVLDYWRESRTPDLNNLLLWGARVASAMQPEPLVSFFDAHDMEELVTGTGWRVREHCAPEIQNARYLAGRADGLEVPGFAFLLHLEKPAQA